MNEKFMKLVDERNALLGSSHISENKEKLVSISYEISSLEAEEKIEAK